MWHFVQWHFARTPLEHFHLCPRTPLLHTVTFMFQGQLCVAWTNDETQLQLLCRSHSEQFRLCVLTYHCLHGTAPAYLADSLRLTSEVVARLSLRSADTTTLMVPPTRRVTFGDRAFPVAAARAWNSLPLHIRAASSLSSFRRQTKAHLSVSPVNVPAVTLTDCANNAARFYNLKKIFLDMFISCVKCPCNFVFVTIISTFVVVVLVVVVVVVVEEGVACVLLHISSFWPLSFIRKYLEQLFAL